MSERNVNVFKKELASVLKFLGIEATGNTIKDVLKLTELDEKVLEQKLIKGIFNVYDSNGDGKIDLNEFKTFWRDIASAMGDEEMQNLSDGMILFDSSNSSFKDQMREIMSLLDTDKNGTVEWSEFEKWFETFGKL